MASLNWNSTHSNAPAPASLQSNPQVYSAAPAFRNVEYGSYAPYQHMGPDSLSSVQMPSSIGPSRSNQRSTGIVTRRKAAQMAAGQTGHVRDNSNGSISDGQQQRPNSLGYMHGSGSRPHTPNDYTMSNGYQHHQPTELPPLSLPGASPSIHPNSGSPQYSATPASASPYSPYSYFNTHSRSNSNSNSNPRSTSPTLSTASALTSVSSSATANSFGHPTTPGNMSPMIRKHKKQRLFNVDRKEICLYHKENPNARQEDIAIKYGVERSTISKILKHKQKWMNVPEDEELKVAKHRPSKFPEIETELVNWLSTFTSSNTTTLSDSLIRSKAKEVAKNLRISEDKFKASSGWVENFKHRHGIRRGVWYGDGKLMKPPTPLSTVSIPSSNVPDQRGGLLPSFNSGFSTNVSGDSVGDRNTFRDVPMEEDSYRSRSLLSLRPPWSSSDRSPIVESISGSSSSKATSNQSYSQTDTPASAVSMHSSMSLRSAWEPAQPSPLDRPCSYDDHHQHHDNTSPTAPSNSSYQNNALPSIHPYVSAPSPPPPADTDGQYTGMAVYSTMPPIYRPTVDAVPDITEAENAVDKIIRYIDAQPDGYISNSEREALTQIKYALFQTGGGYNPRDKR